MEISRKHLSLILDALNSYCIELAETITLTKGLADTRSALLTYTERQLSEATALREMIKQLMLRE